MRDDADRGEYRQAAGAFADAVGLDLSPAARSDVTVTVTGTGRRHGIEVE
jgi:hypothetical protein